MWIYNELHCNVLPLAFVLSLARMLRSRHGPFYPAVIARMGYPYALAEHIARSFGCQRFFAVSVCPGP